MSCILSIETSTTVCSVALHSANGLLGESTIYTERSHSEQLGPMILQLMESCRIVPSDLDAVAVSGGPGSYTGLRIGCSMAKGMCFSLNIPMIAVSTLEALAQQVIPMTSGSDLLCPMLDARRMEVYTMVLDRKREVIEDIHPLILAENVFGEYLEKGKVWFFGNGSEKAKGVITHENACFADDIQTVAVTVGEIAMEKFERGEFVDVAYYEPFYLKEFQATKPKNRL